MIDGLKTKAEEYSIVILGHMNPRLHHPLWYQHIGALNEQETNEALESPTMVLVQPVARFDAAGFTVTCQEEAWGIATTQPSNRTRMLEIACRVFEKLGETTVLKFGFNTKLHLQLTSVKNVEECLASALLTLQLGLRDDGNRKSCLFRFTNVYENHSVNVDVHGSPLSRDAVYIAHNTEHAIRPPKDGKKLIHFDLTPLLKEGYEPAFADAVVNAKTMVAAIEKKCGGSNGSVP
jgi:hypothetical protein